MNKQLETERINLMKAAGLLNEDDYSIQSDNTNSGDTDTMNIAEYSDSSIQDMGAATDVVVAALEYMERHADTEDEGGMNEAGRLMLDLRELLEFLQNMK